ncbi:MAG: hypothetical protein Q8755_03490, partial [Candidatus Phytoplasma australasiaticum]|nr:hypothetical protein [Candidatus Phytoplasma australasiaticum]
SFCVFIFLKMIISLHLILYKPRDPNDKDRPRNYEEFKARLYKFAEKTIKSAETYLKVSTTTSSSKPTGG